MLLGVGQAEAQWDVFEHRYEYKPSDVFKGSHFIKKDGYWEAYRGEKLAGYVVLSLPWTKKLIGYSGKHMETLIGMELSGELTGVKVIFHSEPIVLIGLKEDNYKKFIDQYKGKNIKKNLRVGGEIEMDAVTGATVTAIVHNAIITDSARQVASKTGMLKYKSKSTKKLREHFTPLGWKDLIESGAVRNIRITNNELGRGDGIYLDLYYGLVEPVSIGRNVLGEKTYDDIMKRIKEGESAIFIAASGPGSFKGSGFARGGLFDRFSLGQQENSYVFKDRDYRILTELSAKGAPDIKEGGVFIIREDTFNQTSEFIFNLVLPYRVKVIKKFRSFSSTYKIPERFLEN
jgi:NosR/NirI family nitrous oxide reductase transcriptional regulator